MSDSAKIFLWAIIGVLAGFLLLGIFRYFGLPSFDTLLTAVSGENNIWAIIFSLALIVLIVFGIFRSAKKTKEN